MQRFAFFDFLYNKNRKIICEKTDFSKWLILRILTKLHKKRTLNFLRKYRKNKKSLLHLRKMSIFAHDKMGVLGEGFSQIPLFKEN